MNFDQLFKDFSNIKVVVMGDVMLDTYMWGHVDRISPEAPVPIVALDKKEIRIGGAGNVAINLKSLSAKVSVVSVIGKDDEGVELLQLFSDNDIDTSCIINSTKRITTNKTRIISRNQQMMRLDAEMVDDIELEMEQALLIKLEHLFNSNKPDILIFEDYNKGVLTLSLIQKTIALCKKHHVITAVDPKRKNFLSFVGVDIFKPNLKEVKEGLNIIQTEINLSSMNTIHLQLQEHLQHHISLITLSEKGLFYQTNESNQIIPTHVRNVADVSGAGDTVIAVAALVYASTKDFHLAADMANIAGGLVCEEVGTAPINKEKLLQECKVLLKKDR